MIERTTLNAKVAAIGLVIGALLLHFINQLQYQLIPIRLIVIAILVFSAWAFCDEMGLRKPLNRAGFVVFMFSMVALGAATISLNSEALGGFYLIYALSLLISVLIWSLAFLHRQRDIKVVGAIGLAATVLPVAIVVVGHISVGVGAYLGFSGLTELSDASAVLGSKPINIVEAIFVCWAVVTGISLWKGRIALSTVNGTQVL